MLAKEIMKMQSEKWKENLKRWYFGSQSKNFKVMVNSVKVRQRIQVI